MSKLRWIEEQLLAPTLVRSCVITLEVDGKPKSLRPRVKNAHCISFAQDLLSLRASLPRALSTMAEHIRVVFLGHFCDREMLAKLLEDSKVVSVRRLETSQWYTYFTLHNKGYQLHSDLDVDALNELPVDGFPPELLATAVCPDSEEEGEVMLTRHRENYDAAFLTSKRDGLTSGLSTDHDVDQEGEGDSKRSATEGSHLDLDQELTMQVSAMVGMDNPHASAEDYLQIVARGLLQKCSANASEPSVSAFVHGGADDSDPAGQEGFDPAGQEEPAPAGPEAVDARSAAAGRRAQAPLMVMHQASEPLNEFRHLVRIILGGFPGLFTNGCGTGEGLNLENWIKHMLLLVDPRFGQHMTFIFAVFYIIQRRQTLRSLKLSYTGALQNEIGMLASTDLDDEVNELIHQAAAAGGGATTSNVTAGRAPSKQRVRATRAAMRTVGQRVLGAPEKKGIMRKHMRGLAMDLGYHIFFLTFNLSEGFCPMLQVVLGREVDLSVRTSQGMDPLYYNRNVAAMQNPVAVALWFDRVFRKVMKVLFGVTVIDNNGKQEFSPPDGSGFIPIAALYGPVENQGRRACGVPYQPARP